MRGSCSEAADRAHRKQASLLWLAQRPKTPSPRPSPGGRGGRYDAFYPSSRKSVRRLRPPARRGRGVVRPCHAGETLALVGESGSGKSLTALSLLQLLPPGAACTGAVTLDGQPILTASPAALRQARGGTAGIVFQEPMTSLNPLHRIGRQVGEAMALARRPARPWRRRGAAGGGRVPRCHGPPGRLPAPAQRRPAPAGDDRHGAGQQPAFADRRRTHHGAGRDDPGPNPGACWPASVPGAAWPCCSSATT